MTLAVLGSASVGAAVPLAALSIAQLQSLLAPLQQQIGAYSAQLGQRPTIPNPASLAASLRSASNPLAIALSIAKLPISLSFGFYANVVHPEGASPWLTRMVVTFMFPK